MKLKTEIVSIDVSVHFNRIELARIYSWKRRLNTVLRKRRKVIWRNFETREWKREAKKDESRREEKREKKLQMIALSILSGSLS